MNAEDQSDDDLLRLLKTFDYTVLPGQEFETWEEAVHELSDRIGNGPNRELAALVIPEMLRALRSTSPSKQEDIDIRDTALHALSWTPDLLGEEAQTILWESVAHDDAVEVAWIAAGILDDIDPASGDEAWRIYTARPDAPSYRQRSPKPR
jgi:hypothetical protein